MVNMARETPLDLLGIALHAAYGQRYRRCLLCDAVINADTQHPEFKRHFHGTGEGCCDTGSGYTDESNRALAREMLSDWTG